LSDVLTGEEHYDPYEAFDVAAGAGTVRDPYPIFAELRRKGGVHRGGLYDVCGVEWPYGNVFSGSSTGEYTVMSYDAVHQVLRGGDTISSAGYGQSMGLVMGHSILEMDDPEHKDYRGLIEQAFSRKAVQRWEEQIIGPTVEHFIDRFAARGRADLVKELTFPFPVHVITGMLGLPTEELPQFHAWAVELINIAADPGRGLAASASLKDYLWERIDERRSKPKEDLISALAGCELDGHRLTNDEIVAFLRLILPAGGETTYRSSGNLLFGLLTNPEQLEAVRNDRSLLPQAIEEGLRWEAPLTSIGRWATRDVDICGVQVEAGASISVCMGSANHDEARWEHPEEFDVFRPQKPHIAFAFGPHVCIGQHLARVETQVALNMIFDRLPNLRPEPEAWRDGGVHITGFAFRSPTALPVLFG
jgi:cytochrome P450